MTLTHESAEIFVETFSTYEQNRMYPLGYGKEPPMDELDRFTIAIRELNVQCPPTIIILPSHTKGLPVGSYNLKLLLEYIALSLEGKKPLCCT